MGAFFSTPERRSPIAHVDPEDPPTRIIVIYDEYSSHFYQTVIVFKDMPHTRKELLELISTLPIMSTLTDYELEEDSIFFEFDTLPKEGFPYMSAELYDDAQLRSYMNLAWMTRKRSVIRVQAVLKEDIDEDECYDESADGDGDENGEVGRDDDGENGENGEEDGNGEDSGNGEKNGNGEEGWNREDGKGTVAEEGEQTGEGEPGANDQAKGKQKEYEHHLPLPFNLSIQGTWKAQIHTSTHAGTTLGTDEAIHTILLDISGSISPQESSSRTSIASQNLNGRHEFDKPSEDRDLRQPPNALTFSTSKTPSSAKPFNATAAPQRRLMQLSGPNRLQMKSELEIGSLNKGNMHGPRSCTM